MLYMIIEDYRDGDPVPVYRRLRDQGRDMPDGLVHVDSWVGQDLTRCYQVVECSDRAVLDDWMARWDDLVRFRVAPIVTSAEAAARVAPRL